MKKIEKDSSFRYANHIWRLTENYNFDTQSYSDVGKRTFENYLTKAQKFTEQTQNSFVNKGLSQQCIQAVLKQESI